METKYTFWKLITEHKIEIPIIQRDYAQGRKSAVKIAGKFLDDIKYSIINDKPLSLDFVYGKVYEDEKGKTFIPLDGQQRLTTLFLLHWYLAMKQDKLEGDVKNNLSKFTYETRISSQDFCKKLVMKSISYQTKIEKISEQIKNSRWFFLSWKQDPTVNSMLNMLDLISDRFKDLSDNEYQRFINKDKSPITFQFLPLNEFRLTDELYIKMNARGKPLTEFENFKAKYSIYLNLNEKISLDTRWLDIFWNIAKKNGKVYPEKVDNYFFNFFKNITLNLFVEKNGIIKLSLDDYDLFENYKSVYSEDNNISVDKVNRTLESLVDFDDTEKILLSFLQPHGTINYWERVRFYSLMQYFYIVGKIKGNEDIYSRWMRVTKNLINNTLIQSFENYVDAIRSIKKLSDNILDIYGYIGDSPKDISYFLGSQRMEESLKAKLIMEDENWEELFISIERHPYFDGQIGFILDYSKDSSGDYQKKVFELYSEKVNVLFTEFKEKRDFLFQRALLVKGDFLVDIGQNKTFCVFDEALRAKSDNWRKVFNDKKKAMYLKDLLDDISVDSTESDLNTVIQESKIADWRRYLIENPNYISYCKNRQIRQYGEEVTYLLSKKQMNGKHVELYSYDLYKKVLKNEKIIPFNRTSYYISSSRIEPHIVLDGWKYKGSMYSIDIGYKKNYYIRFYDKNENSIPQIMEDKLGTLNFNGNYHLNIHDMAIDKLYSKIEEVCRELKSLTND